MIHPINHLPQTITVGVQTDSGVEVIGFDLKPWIDIFPEMVFTVWPTRPGEDEAYPAGHQMMVGTVLYWYPDGYDTEFPGEGKVEIAGVSPNQRKASGFVSTSVLATSLGNTKEPGGELATWYELVLQAAQDVKSSVDVGDGGLFLVRAYVKDGKTTSDRTQSEVRAAVSAGKTCLCIDTGGNVYEYAGEKDYPYAAQEKSCPMFARYYHDGNGLNFYAAYVLSDGSLAIAGEMGIRTPNPKRLTIAGQEYNGSKAVSVLPAPADVSSTAYLRWNGTEYVPSTIAQLKADLGLN